MENRIETLNILKSIILTHLHNHNFFTISTHLLLSEVETKILHHEEG